MRNIATHTFESYAKQCFVDINNPRFTSTYEPLARSGSSGLPILSLSETIFTIDIYLTRAVMTVLVASHYGGDALKNCAINDVQVLLNLLVDVVDLHPENEDFKMIKSLVTDHFLQP